MTHDLSLDVAVDLLREVVTDLRARGRTTVAAGIKPELQRRSPAGFDERALGFDRFSDFLDFAAARGRVEVSRRRGQPVVDLPGQGSDDVHRAGVQGRRRPRVRPDLWEAFTNWGKWQRVWDKELALAIRLPEQREADTPEMRARREEWETHPERFVQIPELSEEEQLGWMRDFAQAEPGKTGLLLRYAIDQEDRKAHAFSQAARLEPAVYARWMDTRVSKVVAAIEKWKAANGIDVGLYDHDRSAREEEDVAPRPADGTPVATAETELRVLAHRAIDNMTYEELINLPIRLGHVARRA